MNNKYYDSLASLRGIFILIIVLYHINSYFGQVLPSQLHFIYTYGGAMGNYFFFMLSGFLIAHSYKDKVSSNEIDFISFIKNRLSRIYPLYIVTNMLALFINICVNGWGNSIRLSGLVKVFLWLQQAGLMMNILIMVHVGL